MSKEENRFQKFLYKNESNIITIFKSLIPFLILVFLSILLAFYSSGTSKGVFVFEKELIDFWLTKTFYGATLIITTLLASYFIVLRRYQFQYWQYLLFGAACSYYLILRFEVFEKDWKFIDLFWKIDVIDPFFFIALLVFLYSFYRQFLKKNNDDLKKSSIFLEDNPLEDEEEIASYNNLLEQIKPILYTDRYEKSFSVAIVGAWGSGKSSFIQALTKNIIQHNKRSYFNVEEQVLHFNFSPFLNHDENSIIKEFFTKLSHLLGKRSGKLSNQLIAYSKKLTNLAKEGDLLSFLTPVQSELFNQSAHELYESISDTIKDLNVKIVITIDDLDRLSEKEILEVLKLVRNTSNFPNTVFFVALDKDYVIKTINLEKSKATEYLDKFFQLEISIAKVPKSKVLSYLEDELIIFLNNFDTNFKDSKKLRNFFKLRTLEIHISSFREVKRFYNQFVLDFKLVNQVKEILKTPDELDIQINDLINLTLLKLYYPDVFKSLYFDELKIFEEDVNFRVLTSDSIEMSEDSIGDIVCRYFTPNDINKSGPFYHVPMECKYLIIALFSVHYSQQDDGPFVFKNAKIPMDSVVNKQVLNRYFERTNFESKSISNVEYLKLINENSDIILKIKELSNNVVLFDSFVQRLIRDSNVSLIRKIKCLNEVLINKSKQYEKIVYELSIAFYQLHSKQNNDFNQVFIELLKDERVSFQKKCALISDLEFELGEFKSSITKEQFDEVKLVVESGANFFMENVSLNMFDLNVFYDIWSYFDNNILKEILLEVFKVNFYRIDAIQFFEWQLMYKEKDKGFVFKQPIVKNMLGTSDDILALLNRNRSNAQKMKELKAFFSLQKIFEGITIRYYFHRLILGVGVYSNAKGSGEIIFRVRNEKLFRYFKSSSLFNSYEYKDKRAIMKPVVGKDSHFYLIFDIDTNFSDMMVKIKDDIISKIPNEYQLGGVEDDKASPYQQKIGWLKTGDNKPLVDIFSVQYYGSKLNL